VIGAMVLVIGVCYLVELVKAHPDLGAAGRHAVVPEFAGGGSVLLAVGILGATVMPHVIWLHSALTQGRTEARTDSELRRLMRYTRLDVVLAMTTAGLINMAMLVMAASTFFRTGHHHVESLEAAHRTLEPVLGSAAGALFALALLASGLSSSAVGTLAGQVVMQGFIRRRLPLVLRRSITMAPAFVVIGLGADPSRTLVLSQVILSFGIPFALVPLVWFTSRAEIMGRLVNGRATTVAAALVAALIVALNVFLLVQTAGIG
jgi:manganese transport protein